MSLAPRKARLKTAGAAPGSIIAAIIGSHSATKDANELSRPQRPCPFVHLSDIVPAQLPSEHSYSLISACMAKEEL
jgi:hypothetical protein